MGNAELGEGGGACGEVLPENFAARDLGSEAKTRDASFVAAARHRHGE